jgi:hypothetical protein
LKGPGRGHTAEARTPALRCFALPVAILRERSGSYARAISRSQQAQTNRSCLEIERATVIFHNGQPLFDLGFRLSRRRCAVERGGRPARTAAPPEPRTSLPPRVAGNATPVYRPRPAAAKKRALAAAFACARAPSTGRRWATNGLVTNKIATLFGSVEKICRNYRGAKWSYNTFGRSGQIRSQRSCNWGAPRFGQLPLSCSFHVIMLASVLLD